MSQSPVYAGPLPPARRSRWALPASVRRSDLDSLRIVGPPLGPLPKDHGDRGDPRYPSPVRLRRAGAFVTDVAAHFLLAAGALAAAASMYPDLSPGWQLAAFFGAYAVASFAHRVLLQAAFQATAGKALTGLRVIHVDDGGPPGVAVLMLAWLAGIALIASEILANC